MSTVATDPDVDKSGWKWVDIAHIYRWPGEDGTPPQMWCSTRGDVLSTGHEMFSWADLARFAQEAGVERWVSAIELASDDYEDLPGTLQQALALGLCETVPLVGLARAPIAHEDVLRSYHQGTEGLPMVSVKVHDASSATVNFAELREELRDAEDEDSLLRSLSDKELRERVDSYSAEHDHVFEMACEANFEATETDARELFGPQVECWREGRSGGWLVVNGLPDIEDWTVSLLTKWHTFTEYCAAYVADIPSAMVALVLNNHQSELAGRRRRVVLNLVLSDEDINISLAGVDWTRALGLSPSTSVFPHIGA